MIVALELVKKWVCADEQTADDAVLTQATEAAEEHIINETHRTLAELKAMSADGTSFPKPLQQAVLMLAAHWYNNPEAVASVITHEVAHSLQALIKPYRRLV